MQCPFCAETIKDEAIFCIHCRHDISIPKPLSEQNKALFRANEGLKQLVAELRTEVMRMRALQTTRPVVDWRKELLF
jgi:hypothetical protein